jgi:hypothetical protein
MSLLTHLQYVSISHDHIVKWYTAVAGAPVAGGRLLHESLFQMHHPHPTAAQTAAISGGLNLLPGTDLLIMIGESSPFPVPLS